MSYSGFFSINNSLADVTKALLKYYMPEGGVIYDPTCGEKNYQFAWLRKHNTMALECWMGSRAKAMVQMQSHYQYVCSDLKPVGDFIASLKHLPLKDKFAGITWLDPPFTPTRDSRDLRAKEFGVDQDRTPQEIKAYYAADILKELARVTKKYIFVRGQDFYYPPNTTNYYDFKDVTLYDVDKVKELKHIGTYTARYNHSKLPLFRYRLRHVIRPIITYSKIAVLKVMEATP